MAVNVFITGASGYIGGTVLAKLLGATPKLTISALVRKPEYAAKLKELGVRPVNGTLADLELLTKESSDCDAVINCADNDDLPAVKSIIAGLSLKFSNTGKKGLLIQTSGTGELNDFVDGEPGEIIYDDLEGLDDVQRLPLTQPHRPVDNFISNGEHRSKVGTVIICPPFIYGTGQGAFSQTGYELPALARSILGQGSPQTLGRGLNRWSDVHVSDLADLYLLVLQKGLKGELATGYEGWFFAENGEHELKEITVKVAKVAKKKGLINNIEPTPMDDAAVEKYFGGKSGRVLWAGNCRSRAKRARQLGWKPKMGPIEDYIGEAIDAEIAKRVNN